MAKKSVHMGVGLRSLGVCFGVWFAVAGCDSTASGTQMQPFPQAAPPGSPNQGQVPGSNLDPMPSMGEMGSIDGIAQPMAGTGGTDMPMGDPAMLDSVVMPDPGDVPDGEDPMAMGMPMEMAPPMREDLGEGDGSDVIAIGDSWMNLFSSGIQQSLVRASGQPYRTYGVPGTRLLSEQIPDQYESAKRANSDIKTVVMTGGGNDIIQVPGLRDDCDAGGDLCGQEVGKILDRLSALWEEMADDGVQDVVYVQYSDPDGNDVDFALPNGESVVTRCAAVPEPLRCHTLETNAIVMQDIPDGIHPSAAGFDRLGQAVYEMMIERGMRR